MNHHGQLAEAGQLPQMGHQVHISVPGVKRPQIAPERQSVELGIGDGDRLHRERIAFRLARRGGHHQAGELGRLPHRAQLVAVATDLWTGHEIWLSEGKVVDAMRASLSLPGIFKPKRVNGHWLVDGALVNPVPVSVCRALGAEMIIAVNLNADVFGKGNVSGEMDDGLTADEVLTKLGQARRAALSPTATVMRQIFGHGHNAPSVFSVRSSSVSK